jgi:hypothetical protein
MIVDRVRLPFYVDQDGGVVALERLPGTWSAIVADQARRAVRAS